MRFVLGCIPSFDGKISAMKNNDDEYPSIPKWKFSTNVTFKTLITQHQYQLILRQTKKKDI